MLKMHELRLSMPEPMLSLSMLILATCPEHAQECSEHCSARSERSERPERSEHFWTLGTMFGNTTGHPLGPCLSLQSTKRQEHSLTPDLPVSYAYNCATESNASFGHPINELELCWSNCHSMFLAPHL